MLRDTRESKTETAEALPARPSQGDVRWSLALPTSFPSHLGLSLRKRQEGQAKGEPWPPRLKLEAALRSGLCYFICR